MQETWVPFLALGDSLEKGMTTHSSILAWRIPWTEEPGRLQSSGIQTVRHSWATNTSLQATEREAIKRRAYVYWKPSGLLYSSPRSFIRSNRSSPECPGPRLLFFICLKYSFGAARDEDSNLHLTYNYAVTSVWFFSTPWTVARQAPLSMGFPREEYWSGLPCPPPGDLPNPEIEPISLMSPTLAGKFFTTSTTWEPLHITITNIKRHQVPSYKKE